MAPEAREHARRWFLPWRQGQRIGQVAQIVLAGDEVAGGAEALDRATVRQGGKDGDRATPIGDPDRGAAGQCRRRGVSEPYGSGLAGACGSGRQGSMTSSPVSWKSSALRVAKTAR
jgi:hypothetical protein